MRKSCPFLSAVVVFVIFSFSPRQILAVSINEFLANPSTGNKEWVEFYNPDTTDLSTYWLDDDTSFTDDGGSGTKKTLSNLNTVNSRFPYLELSSFLNNAGDYVVLFNSSGTIIDQYQYTSDPGKDIAIGRYPDGTGSFAVLNDPTPGTINSAPVPTPVVTQDEPISTAPSPTIDFSSSDKATIGEAFKVSFALKNFDANTEYFVKVRGGLEENTLGKMQTQAGNIFLAESATWNKFPIIKTNSDGGLNGEVLGRLNEEREIGKYKIQLRFMSKDKTTDVNSGFREITFSTPSAADLSAEDLSKAEALAKATQELPKPATPSAQISQSVSASTSQHPNIKISSSSGSTLGTQSASIPPPINSSASAVLSPPSKTSSPSAISQSKKSQTNAFISQSLIMLGLLISAIGLFRFSQKPR